MIQSLTSFRFITAFLVFLFHCTGALNWKIENIALDKLITHGAVFMTGFFVLSGFIMAHVYQKTDFNRSNILNFYLKRFAKIYPTYIVATIAYFAFIHKDYTVREWIRIAVNDLFLTQAFFPSMFKLGLNGGTWSLTVEAFLYLLFPLLLILSNKSPKFIWFGLGIGALVTLNVNFNREDYFYANPIFRLGDFMVGMGFYFIKDKEIFKKNILHFAMVFLLILSVIFFGKKQSMAGQLVFISLFGAWITCIYHSKSTLYNNRALEYLGQISYSFYLWQFAALEIGKFLNESFDINILLVVLLTFLINIILSSFSYYLLEERARKFILKPYNPFKSLVRFV